MSDFYGWSLGTELLFEGESFLSVPPIWTDMSEHAALMSSNFDSTPGAITGDYQVSISLDVGDGVIIEDTKNIRIDTGC
jgi:hypothetical protein